MEGKIDYLVACASSGGTISGVGQYLKEKNSAIKIIMADPVGSVYYGYFKNGVINPKDIGKYLVEGAGKNYICRCMDFSIVDDVIRFRDEDMLSTLKDLVNEEGILAGGSSGAALFVAKQLVNQIQHDANIVVIMPDSGLKYISKFQTS